MNFAQKTPKSCLTLKYPFSCFYLWEGGFQIKNFIIKKKPWPNDKKAIVFFYYYFLLIFFKKKKPPTLKEIKNTSFSLIRSGAFFSYISVNKNSHQTLCIPAHMSSLFREGGVA